MASLSFPCSSSSTACSTSQVSDPASTFASFQSALELFEQLQKASSSSLGANSDDATSSSSSTTSPQLTPANLLNLDPAQALAELQRQYAMSVAASRRKQAKPTKLPSTTPPPVLTEEENNNGSVLEGLIEGAPKRATNGSRKRSSSPLSIEEQFRNQLKENHLLMGNGKRFITSPEFLTSGTANGEAIDLSQKPNNDQNEPIQIPVFEEKSSLMFFEKFGPQYLIELYNKAQNAQQGLKVDNFDVPTCSNSGSGRTSVLSSCNENGSSFESTQNSCPIPDCSETFTKRSSLLWHITTSHPSENLLQCDECEETFCDVVQLREHRCGSAVPRPISAIPFEKPFDEDDEKSRKVASVPALRPCVPFHFRDESNKMRTLEEESSSDDAEEANFKSDNPTNEAVERFMDPPLLANQLLDSLAPNSMDMMGNTTMNMAGSVLDLSMGAMNNNKLNFGGQFGGDPAHFMAFSPMMQMRGPGIFMPPGMISGPPPNNGSSSLNNDDDWESMMEINTSDEAEKIRALVGDKPLPTTDPNQCVVCRRVLSCKSALQMHYRTHTGERPFKCKICQRAFTTKGNLKTHMGVHRGKAPSLRFVSGPQAMGGNHVCAICQKRYPTPQMLQQHVAQHTNQLRSGIMPPFPLEGLMKPPSSGSEAQNPLSTPPNPFLPQNFFPTPTSGAFPPPLPIIPGLFNFGPGGPFMSPTGNPMNLILSAQNPSDLAAPTGIPSTPSTPSVAASVTPVAEFKPVEQKLEQMIKKEATIAEKPKEDETKVIQSVSTPTISLPPLPPLLMKMAPKEVSPKPVEVVKKTVSPAMVEPTKNSGEIFESEAKPTPVKPQDGPAPSSINSYGLWKITGAQNQEKVSTTILDAFASRAKAPEIKASQIEGQLLNLPSAIPKAPIAEAKKVQLEIPKSATSSGCLMDMATSIERKPDKTATTPVPKLESKFDTLLNPDEKSSDGDQGDEPSNPLAAIEKMWAEKEPTKETSTRPPVQLQKHQCSVCFKHFSSSSALQIHMRTHTGDKPFKCHVCSRAFTTRGNLKVHMGTHENQGNPSRRGRRIFDFAPDSARLDVARQQLLGGLSMNPNMSPQTMSPILPLLGIPPLGLGMPPLFPPVTANASTGDATTSPSIAAGTPTTPMDAMFLLAMNICPICQKLCANPQEREQHFKTHFDGFTANTTGIANKSNNDQPAKLM